MKYLLFIIVALAVYIHFYPESEPAKQLEKYKQLAIEEFSSATDTKVRLSANKVFNDIEKEFASFSSDERAVVSEITESRKTITTFFKNHCGANPEPSQLHHENQKKVCTIISKYQSLF